MLGDLCEGSAVGEPKPVPYRPARPSGVAFTGSSVSKLSSLTKRITACDNHHRVGDIQRILSGAKKSSNGVNAVQCRPLESNEPGRVSEGSSLWPLSYRALFEKRPRLKYSEFRGASVNQKEKFIIVKVIKLRPLFMVSKILMVCSAQ